MGVMQAICVYCGSKVGLETGHQGVAAETGRVLARQGLAVICGGGHVGLMGVVADAALREGGRVIGVIPHFMVERELAHEGLTELRVVGSMHERKALMAELADAFLVLPGGLGTLEELFETWTWAQLGIHNKPIGLVNAGGFFDDLLAFLDRAVAAGFVSAANRGMLKVEADPQALLKALAAHTPSRPGPGRV